MDDELRRQKLERAINFAMADQPLIPVLHPTFDFTALIESFPPLLAGPRAHDFPKLR